MSSSRLCAGAGAGSEVVVAGWGGGEAEASRWRYSLRFLLGRKRVGWSVGCWSDVGRDVILVGESFLAFRKGTWGPSLGRGRFELGCCFSYDAVASDDRKSGVAAEGGEAGVPRMVVLRSKELLTIYDFTTVEIFNTFC